MPFHKITKDTHEIKDQFKIGDSINSRELGQCMIRACSFEVRHSQ